MKEISAMSFFRLTLNRQVVDQRFRDGIPLLLQPFVAYIIP